jgi:hypothetical protein
MIEGDLVVNTKLLQFFEANGLFSPDTAISAIVANIEEFSYLRLPGKDGPVI